MGKTIRILHIIGIMDRGGAETMIMNLYRNINRDIIQFDFVENTFCKAAYDDEIKSLGGKIYNCPHFNGKNYIAYKKWWKHFFDEHQDEYRIIHGHIGSCATIYLKEAKKRGIYTIAHSHNTGDHSIESLLYKMASYRTRYIADYFFACSQAAGIDRYGKKVASGDNYRVLNNAVDTQLYKYSEEKRKKIREEFNIPKDSLVIGHVGRFMPVKNHLFLIDIFKELLKEVPNAKLILVGDGPLKKDVEEKIKRLNIEDNCVLTGIRTDVDCLMQAFDVLVFPSLFEGLPVTLVEAQASGLPFIISEGVPNESIIIKELGCVRNLNDSMQKWVESITQFRNKKREDTTDKMIEARYDIKTTARELEELYIEKYGFKRN